MGEETVATGKIRKVESIALGRRFDSRCFRVCGVVADVRFPAVFTPGAVLQRDARVPIWGWAEPGEKVTVSFAGQEKLAKAEVDGKWQIELDEMGAAQPRPLIVEGANRIVVEDVAVGDVWICAGQSNMGCPVT